MRTTDIILSTRNQSKAHQIKAVFDGLPVRILTLEEAGISGEAVEDGATLEENALKKALFAWERTVKWSIADDTGIFIDALDGLPGVHSARWAGEHATTEEIMRFTLEKLKGVPLENRTATFKTVATIVAPHGIQTVFTGAVKGIILLEPRALCQPKMPYSAIFKPDDHSKVWAEMSAEEQNAVSHRGQAFRQAREFFAEKLK
ncbi:MAG: non-canonical purine NTP pyrophosphatase [bacterium]|nr:non-canonical purine NTP pyrophosphatase [bacterium]